MYEPTDPLEEEIAERYSRSVIQATYRRFSTYSFAQNFQKYVNYFAESRDLHIVEGSMFKVAHCPKDKISILDFKIGSPAAALVIDLIAYLPIRVSLLLGMCGAR